jgi:hypothetical protein
VSLGLRRIDTATQVSPPLAGVVLIRSSLRDVESAQALMETARLEAAAFVEAARQAAQRAAGDALREREADLLRREAALEQMMWERTAAFTDAVAQEWERTLQELETRAQAIVTQALSRLTLEAPAPARVLACVQELARQARPPDTGVLWVAPDDLPAVSTLHGLPWPLHASGEVAPGTVRLVAAQGRWECDIAGALERMLQALAVSGASVEPLPLNTLSAKENDDAGSIFAAARRA